MITEKMKGISYQAFPKPDAFIFFLFFFLTFVIKLQNRQLNQNLLRQHERVWILLCSRCLNQTCTLDKSFCKMKKYKYKCIYKYLQSCISIWYPVRLTWRPNVRKGEGFSTQMIHFFSTRCCSMLFFFSLFIGKKGVSIYM